MASDQFFSALFAELGVEIRSRRDPEHIYTAAAIGACAAIAGGVAAVTALASVSQVPFWRHPAFIGAIACFLLGLLVIGKIEHEHEKYKDLRQAHIDIAEAFAKAAGDDALLLLPKGLRNPIPAAEGYLHSSRIVLGTALVCAAFCLSVWYGTVSAGPGPSRTSEQQPKTDQPSGPAK